MTPVHENWERKKIISTTLWKRDISSTPPGSFYSANKIIITDTPIYVFHLALALSATINKEENTIIRTYRLRAPSNPQTSRLLYTSLSLGIPFPRST